MFQWEDCSFILGMDGSIACYLVKYFFALVVQPQVVSGTVMVLSVELERVRVSCFTFFAAS